MVYNSDMTDVFDVRHPEEPSPSLVEGFVPEPDESNQPEPVQALTVQDNLLPVEFASLPTLIGPAQLEWEAHHPLSPSQYRRHYLVLGALGVIGGAVALWQASIMTALAVAAGLGALEIRERHSTAVKARIDEQGIAIDHHRYEHTELASFDVHRMPDGTHQLSLKTHLWHSPRITVPLGTQDPHGVRAVMLNYVLEQRHGVNLLDWWIRKG